MAVKLKTKSKHIKKAAVKTAARRKSSVSKRKRAKPAARKTVKRRIKSVSKVEARAPAKGSNGQLKVPPVQKTRSNEYVNAIHAYESGLKLMHAENYEKATKAFGELINEHTGEAEI